MSIIILLSFLFNMHLNKFYLGVLDISADEVAGNGRDDETGILLNQV